MKIKLITSDFKGSDYQDICNCPLAKALKRSFKSVGVLISSVLVDSKWYEIDRNIWSKELVTNLIEQANEGKEVEYELEIPGLGE